MSLPLAKGHAIYKRAAGSSPDRPQRTLIETAICSHSESWAENHTGNSDRAAHSTVSRGISALCRKAI